MSFRARQGSTAERGAVTVGAEPIPDDIPAIHWLAAYATHGGLHALLIVQTLTGWIATSANRAHITVLCCSMLSPIWSRTAQTVATDDEADSPS
jgi:cytochrome b561